MIVYPTLVVYAWIISIKQYFVKEKYKFERRPTMLYNPNRLKDFDKEWGIHEGTKEWWYATAVVFDEEGNMYSYQYTLLHIGLGVVTAKMGMIALTDYKNGRHYYLQTRVDKDHPLVINDHQASVKGVSEVIKFSDSMKLRMFHHDFTVDADMDYGKGAFWHCDNGKLQMGKTERKETTSYFSYTNMPTKAVITINGEPIKVTGKTWFDKQGGTYSITDSKTHWEWFSLRFNDDEEIMLFTFPQDNYYDGTYITKDGKSSRMNDYSIQTTATTKFKDLDWSAGWELHIPVKEKDYTIEPIQQGHMNFGYFEEICYIKNSQGEIVGYAFAELLPGVLNGNLTATGDTNGKSAKASNIPSLFSRIEFVQEGDNVIEYHNENVEKLAASEKKNRIQKAAAVGVMTALAFVLGMAIRSKRK